MKKLLALLLISLLIIVVPTSVLANWVTANKVQVSWDANDTSDVDPAIEKLIYRVYLTNVDTDPDKTNPALVGETEDTLLVVTLAVKGKYRAGVRAVLQVLADDGTTWEDVAESGISWSDDPTVTKDGIIFGIRFYPAPLNPVGITAGQ